MQQPILTPQQLEAYNRGEAVTIQKVKEVKRAFPYESGLVTTFQITRDGGSVKIIGADSWSWNNYLAFYTKEELQKEMQYIEARSYIRAYIANNFGEWKPDWSNEDQLKWYPYYDYINNKWDTIDDAQSNSPQPYPFLQTKYQCCQLIRDCEPQLNILRDFFN